MKSSRKATITLILGLTICGNAFADCDASDFDCLANSAIIDAVTKPSNRSGLADYAIGIACGDEGLQKYGGSVYNGSSGAILSTAQSGVKVAVATAPPAVASAITARVETSVKLTQAAEVAGIAEGIKAAFGPYPRTKAEFCLSARSAIPPVALMPTAPPSPTAIGATQPPEPAAAGPTPPTPAPNPNPNR